MTPINGSPTTTPLSGQPPSPSLLPSLGSRDLETVTRDVAARSLRSSFDLRAAVGLSMKQRNQNASYMEYTSTIRTGLGQQDNG